MQDAAVLCQKLVHPRLEGGILYEGTRCLAVLFLIGVGHVIQKPDRRVLVAAGIGDERRQQRSPKRTERFRPGKGRPAQLLLEDLKRFCLIKHRMAERGTGRGAEAVPQHLPGLIGRAVPAQQQSVFDGKLYGRAGNAPQPGIVGFRRE